MGVWWTGDLTGEKVCPGFYSPRKPLYSQCVVWVCVCEAWGCGVFVALCHMIVCVCFCVVDMDCRTQKERCREGEMERVRERDCIYLQELYPTATAQ